MYLRNEIIQEKKLIGNHLAMTFAANRTPDLWKKFMPLRNQILNRVTTDLISLQIYSPDFDFIHFNPQLPFDKWALAEVSEFASIPESMESFILESGLYAVFLHSGPASEGLQTFEYIFSTWMPGSDYEVDDRPHFEILGNQYINDSPLSKEEIWIPIR